MTNISHSTAGDSQRFPLLEKHLNSLRRQLPVMDNTLREHGDKSLFEYVNTFTDRSSVDACQSRDDFGEAINQYLLPLLGKELAAQAQFDVEQIPAALTANHHGIDFFAQSVQGSLIFALPALSGQLKTATIPVLACGNIPINNLTYPRGALFYDCRQQPLVFPHRVPVFPDRLKRTVVARAPAFSQEMISRASHRLSRDEEVSEIAIRTMEQIFKEDYCQLETLQAGSYSEQAVQVNNALWKRMFTESRSCPALVYMELEKIAGLLLVKDLTAENSLAATLFYSGTLSLQLQEELNEADACWNVASLYSRYAGSSSQKSSGLHSGTFLFWGIDRASRRIPLVLDCKDGELPVLLGKSDQGESWEIPLTGPDIRRGLLTGDLLPSLYTCYLVIALARGISCVGGYYQAAYLPVMQRGTVRVLARHNQYAELAEKVSRTVTDDYLSGMQAVMFVNQSTDLLPAGPVEIISAGGLTQKHIDQAGKLTVADAHKASLLETLADIDPASVKPIIDRQTLIRELTHYLNETSIPVLRADPV